MGLLLRGATLSSGSSCAGVRLTGPVGADVRVDGERVAWIDPPGTLGPAPGDATHDLTGYLLLPAPAEPHAHLDLALLAGPGPVPAVREAEAHAARATRLDLQQRARRAALRWLANGATAVRTHVFVGGGAGLRHLEVLLGLRDELAGIMTLQIVALAVPPTTGAAGTANAAALRAALAMGADLAGGAPGLDPDPHRATAGCLDAAADAGTGVDLHVDDVAALARQVLASGFDGPVTAAACAWLRARHLAAGPRSEGARLHGTQLETAHEVAAARIGVVGLPQNDLRPGGPVAAGVLRAANVRVAAGGGNLRDPFHPMGRMDPLETAALLVSSGQLSPTQAYTAVSATARAVMGLPVVPDGGVLTNDVPAELVALRGSSLTEALASADPDRTVISRGRVAVRTRVTRSLPLPATVTQLHDGTGG